MDQKQGDIFLIFIQRIFEKTQSKDVLGLLLDNGFDQWEQTKELDIDILNEIGITDQFALDVLQVIQETIATEQQVAQDKSQDIQCQNQNPLTIKILMTGVLKKAQKPKYGQSQQQIENDLLLSVNTLSLNNKKITSLSPCIRLCHNIQVLHIFENSISQLDDLQGLNNIKIIYAQDNNIYDASGVEQLNFLEKIYLDKNCLTNLPQFPQSLTVLSLSNQKIKVPLRFTEESVQKLQRLNTLQCENSNVTNINALKSLYSIVSINLKKNQIQDFEVKIIHQWLKQDMDEALHSLSTLEDLDLRGNPVAQLPKYRDQVNQIIYIFEKVVLLQKSIQSLDGKDILQHERQFIINLGKQKLMYIELCFQQNSRRNQSTGERVQEKSKKPEVNGREMTIHFDKKEQQKGFYDQKCNMNTKHIPKSQKK